MSIPSIAQLVGSLTGLITGTGGLLISYLILKHTYWKDSFSVKLEIAEGLLVWPQLRTPKPKFSESMLTVKIANIGNKAFTVTAIGLEVGKRSGGFFINQPHGTVQLPYILQPDTTCDFWTEYKSLLKDVKKKTKRNQIKVRAYARDYIGNSFRSNWHTMRFRETRWFKTKTQIKKAWIKLLTKVAP